ncbi:MAG: TetR/AcrR family transcriptional regulator, partial [Oscillospiraceae bacterium]
VNEMPEIKEISKKQILIFDAVLKQLNEGANFYNLKVADIAATAGIGKGTVYEYFKSKDDIIIGAILYNFDLLVEDLNAKLSGEKDFDNMLEVFFDCIDNAIKDNAKTFYLLFQNIPPQEKPMMCAGENKGIFSQRQKSVKDAVGRILKVGITQGKIKLHSIDKMNFVLNSTIMGYINSFLPLPSCDVNPKVNIKKLHKYAKDFIILNLQ